ncbi:inorganic diphosphatase [Candidatus Nomurabacteria bacterium]|nr:inorganic diphosphatase [Candidatus Nomurabacteria bacterium]
MNLWHDVSVGENAPEEFTVIIECPKGTKNKYEIDKETGLIKLDRAMKTSQDYPSDYGFAPQTLWDDGDALDVIVLTTNPLFAGCMVNVRPVAVFDMVDCGESDYKVIAVPVDDPRWKEVKDLSDVNPHTIKELQHFFETYKSIEPDKMVEIKAVHGAKEAKEAVERSVEMYKNRK